MADDWHRTTIHECSHESNIGLGCLGPAVVILFVIALVVAMAQDVADKITGTLRPQQQAIPQQPVYQSPPAAPYVPSPVSWDEFQRSTFHPLQVVVRPDWSTGFFVARVPKSWYR